MRLTLTPVPQTAGRILGSYFRSGWAFLVPYVAAYLLYAWLKWPVHFACTAGDTGHGFQIPLLHLYWALHLFHLVVGTIALHSWWSEKRQSGSQSTAELLRPLLPWALLALVFWIPGVYLEFPADPWQHYARTTEWSWHNSVVNHTTWTKSSYFLAYSFIAHITPPLGQLRAFDVYYTACCLLLCWQYYRLARAIGLSERASMVFVLLQTLLFGNNLFGFYRYYGMSSSVFAQIGAVAATRLAMEVFGAGMHPKTKRDDRPLASSRPHSLTLGSPGRLFPPLGEILKFGIALAALLPVIAFNHVQGLMIAAIGIGAVALWRLVACRRAMIGWLALGAVALSIAAIQWWPKHPLLESYRTSGWMTAWYGFNLVVPSSPGLQRAWVMIGAFGGINLVAGVWLIARNHIVGWLTLMPPLALTLPFISIPFANQLAAQNNYIITFHRPLFAIPAGLALVTLGALWRNASRHTVPARAVAPSNHANAGMSAVSLRRLPGDILAGSSQFRFALVLAPLIELVASPAGGPSFNRLYSLLMVPPDDLAMRHVLTEPSLPLLVAAQESLRRSIQAVKTKGGPRDPRISPWTSFESARVSTAPRLLTTPGIGYVAVAGNVATGTFSEKSLLHPPATTRVWLGWSIADASGHNRDAILLVPPATSVFTSESISGYLSRHWLPQDIALEHAAASELESRAITENWQKKNHDSGNTCFTFGTWELKELQVPSSSPVSKSAPH